MSLPDSSIFADGDFYEKYLTWFIYGHFDSVFAYVAADFLNSYIISRTKIWKGGKYVYARFLTGSFFAVLIDQIVFNFLKFFFDDRVNVFNSLGTTLNGIVFTLLIIAIFSYPFSFITEKIKKNFKIDHFDFGAKYNPFRINFD